MKAGQINIKSIYLNEQSSLMQTTPNPKNIIDFIEHIPSKLVSIYIF